MRHKRKENRSQIKGKELLKSWVWNQEVFKGAANLYICATKDFFLKLKLQSWICQSKHINFKND